jgi:hypothetical protein
VSDRHTSRIFDAGRALYDKLNVPGLFPPHPRALNTVPLVTFGDQNPDKGAEKICVVAGSIGDDADQQWARFGPPGRDERFTLLVVGRTLVPAPGQTVLDVWNRLEELADVVQDVLFDRVGKNTVALGFDGEQRVGHALTPLVDVIPTPEGPLGWFSISIRLQAQI